MTKKCAFIGVIGSPNAGKSTLINKLIGSKISIVSSKPQTTRNCIRAISIIEDTQLVFIDTPGIFLPEKSKGNQKKMHNEMVSGAWNITKDTDFNLFIIDSAKGVGTNDKKILEEIKKRHLRTFLVLNKVDLIEPAKLLEISKNLNDEYAFESTFMVSALKGDGVGDIKKTLCKNAPENNWAYLEDEITDAPSRFIATEITREQIFHKFHQEIPHFTAVDTEKWEEKNGKEINIHQVIYVTRESHKKMIIGKGGEGVKNIGTAARKEMQKFFDRKINLFLFVKVNPEWVKEFKALTQ